MKNNIFKYYGAALLAMLCWSFSFIWFKIAYKAYEPMTVILFRITISAAILFVFSGAIKKLQKIRKEDIKLIIWLSFFEPFLYFMGESFGLKYVSSTVAAVIVATIPLFTPIAAWYFYKEKLSWTNVLGLTISFMGVSMVVLNKSFGFSASPLGIALEFVAVLSTIGYAVILKKLTDRYNSYTIVSWQNFIGIFMFLPFWGIFEASKTFQTPFNPEAFMAIVKLAIFASILAFLLYTYSIRNIGINRSSMFINAIPVFVAILAYFILGDQLSAQKIVGICVVIAGLFLAQFKRKKRKNGRKHPIFQA